MSLILDALRKMEQERKARRLDSQELRAEVLSYHGSRPAAAQSRRVPVTVALFIVAAIIALFVYRFFIPSPPVEVADRASVPAPADPPSIPPNILPAVSSPSPPVSVMIPPGSPASSGPEKTISAPKTETTTTPVADNTLTVSGIAWQEDRPLRRAVVNGTLVGEGAVISGARILEIRESFVRFNREGKTFEVSYPAATGR